MAGTEQQWRFGEWLRAHQRIVFKVAAVYAGNTADRDDLAQEIALQAWRSFAAFDPARAKFSTWLYRVALNVAISYLRGRQRSRPGGTEPLDEVHAETVASNAPAHDEALAHAERMDALHALVAGLDPLHRALVLLYLEDKSYTEIADVLGISETNVATKLNRIKQKLRGQAVAAHLAGA